MTAQGLTYSIFEGTLRGFVGGRFFSLQALSGGGGGQKAHVPTAKNPAVLPGLVNNPYMTAHKEVKGDTKTPHSHGGPIPPGPYLIRAPAQHPPLGLAARLDPAPGHVIPHRRDGFYIHGPGVHGSDGCIVPLAHFQELMDALKRANGGTLFVLESQDGSRFA